MKKNIRNMLRRLRLLKLKMYLNQRVIRICRTTDMRGAFDVEFEKAILQSVDPYYSDSGLLGWTCTIMRNGRTERVPGTAVAACPSELTRNLKMMFALNGIDDRRKWEEALAHGRHELDSL